MNTTVMLAPCEVDLLETEAQRDEAAWAQRRRLALATLSRSQAELVQGAGQQADGVSILRSTALECEAWAVYLARHQALGQAAADRLRAASDELEVRQAQGGAV